MNIKQNIPLAPYTTFQIGGPADFFCDITNEEELLEGIAFSKEKKLPISVIGGGSNLLLADSGVRGIVIHIAMKGMVYKDTDNIRTYTVAAGEIWDEFVAKTVIDGFGGLANLSFIPGTVGAAPIQNIGAYGVEAGAALSSLTAINRITGEKRIFSNAECQFSYRDSFFKRVEGRDWIITAVTFALRRDEPLSESYKDIAEYKQVHGITSFTPETLREAIIAIRTKKLPDWRKIGTAGSFFKNPIITKEHFDTIRRTYPDIPGFETESGIKIPLAWVLDHILGVKGLSHGTVGTYATQPLAIVNLGKATFSEVDAFAKELEQKIFDATKIIVEREVLSL